MKGLRKRQSRNEQGNFIILYIGLAAMILVAWNVYMGIGLTCIVNYRSKCALEAASLAAARDLSRIVIDDPKWGYVALTDHPPVGDATCAKDGYPLPVIGINTIFATVRLEMLVAESIGTNEALDCAREDLRSARAASRKLARALRESLKDDSRSDIVHDIYGKEVHPLASARDVYKRNAADLIDNLGWNVNKVSAELGWLENEGTTNTPVPASCDLPAAERTLTNASSYPAFVDVPAGDEEFYFAGLGKQAGLVETGLFRNFESERNCSIVKMTAQLKKNNSDVCVEAVACAQPAYMEDKVPGAYMILRFPDGLPSNTESLRHLLTSNQMMNRIPLFTASGGDYPNDAGSQLKENPGRPTATVKQAVTRAFFDWLRTAHAKPKLDSVIDALDYRFNKHNVSNSYLFAFNDQGQIKVFSPRTYQFTMQTAYESQLYTVAFDAINANGMNWTMRLRDQVHRLGRTDGGKHAGQPMPSVLPVDPDQEEDKRMLSTAGSRYDRSRLAFELEISSPSTAGGKI